MSRSHFEIQKDVKDTGISDMMKRIYRFDFIEPRTKFKDLIKDRLGEIFFEDQNLKIIVDQVYSVETHYETSLPLKNLEMTLPNNRVMAEK